MDRVRRWSAAVALAALLSGCGPGAPTLAPRSATPIPASPSRASPSGSSSPTASAAGVPSQEPDWRAIVIGETPLIDGPSIDDVAHLLAGAFLADGDTVHGWVVGFTGTVGTQSVLHLRWVAGDESAPVVDPVDIDVGAPVAAPGAIPTSVIELPDGTFAMYGWARPVTDGDQAVFWRASASTTTGPWVADPGTFFEMGEPSAWDGSRIDFPTVLLDANSSQQLVYEGAGLEDPDASHIGIARSSDGITWTRDELPVIGPGHCGSGDEASVFMPRPFATGDGLGLAYLGSDGTTNRGIYLSLLRGSGQWRCQGPAPLLPGAVFADSGGIHSFGAFQVGGVAHLVVEVLSSDFDTSGLWLVRLEPVD